MPIYDNQNIENTPEQPLEPHSQSWHMYDGWHSRYGGIGLSGVIALPNTTFEEWLMWYKRWVENFSSIYNKTIDDIDNRLTANENHDEEQDTSISGLDSRLVANEAHDLVQDREISDILSSGWLVTPTRYGLVGDGVADDSDAVQAALDEVTSHGSGLVLFPPAKKIKLTKPMNVSTDTAVDFNGSEVIWDGSVSNNTGRFIGIFNAKGKITGELYSATNVVLKTNEDSSDSVSHYAHDGYLTCEYASTFAIGDYVLLKLDTGRYSATNLNPKDEKLVKITDIKDTQIFIDYSSPFDYQKYTTVATIQKVEPVFNVSFKNTKIIDKKIIYTDKNPGSSHPEVLTFVSGISIQYGVNILLDKIDGYNTKLPVLFLDHLNNVTVKRGTLDSAAIVGPGEGYYTQFNYCTNILFDKGNAEKSRHLVDFTGSSFATVSNSSANRMYSMAFQLHGAYEHHITYINCSGTFNADSGTLFGNANRLISFIKFTGWLTSNGYTSDYTISDSDIKLMRAFTGLVVNSSKVLLDLGDGANPPYTPDTRSAEKTYTIFNTCVVDIMASGQSGIISGFDTFAFNSSDLRAKRESKDLTADGGFLVDFLNTKNIGFNNTEIKRLKFRIKTTTPMDVYFKLLSSTMVCSAKAYHITAKGLTNSRVFAIIDKNKFVNGLTTNTNVDLMQLVSPDNNSSSVQNIIFSSNYVERANILSSYSNAGDSYISDSNIIKSSSYIVGGDIPHQKLNDIAI